MKCEDALSLINARLDGEIPDGSRVALESHLSSCADCRLADEELSLVGTDLRRAFKPHRYASQNLADDVVNSIQGHARSSRFRSVREVGPHETRAVDWRSLVLAVVVGFLLALVIFPPSAHQPEPQRDIAGSNTRPPNLPLGSGNQIDNDVSRIATLVASTGDVQFDSGTGSWSQATASLLRCPSDSRVRTAKDARCELVTSDGAVIRMNGETELWLRSPREVELQKGQVFCRTPEDVSIEVYACELPASPAPQKISWSAAGSGAGFLTALSPKGDGQVVSSLSCSVSVKTESGQHQLKPGESASITNGQIDSERPTDPLLAASWIHPLLTQKGHDSPELHERVDELLARIGRNKMSMLYEREIRSLGEYCVLPLIRFVQSPISKKEPGRRGSAMAIVADLAPSIAIGELLPLLQNESSEVRYHTARALFRLTGESLGRNPSDWREPLDECQGSIEAWSVWWQRNGRQFRQVVESIRR